MVNCPVCIWVSHLVTIGRQQPPWPPDYDGWTQLYFFYCVETVWADAGLKVDGDIVMTAACMIQLNWTAPNSVPMTKCMATVLWLQKNRPLSYGHVNTYSCSPAQSSGRVPTPPRQGSWDWIKLLSLISQLYLDCSTPVLPVCFFFIYIYYLPWK